VKYFSFVSIIVVFFASCMTFRADITNFSEGDQLIEVTINEVSFDSNEPLIEKITINVKNISNSTITFIPEKCYFQDDKGNHILKIPPLNIRSNNNVNIPIESFDYYKMETNNSGFVYGYMYFGSSNSKASMQNLNVKYLEINLCYKVNEKEYIGIYKIDVSKAEKNV